LSEIRDARLQKANSLVSRGFTSYAESFKVSHTTKYLIQNYHLNMYFKFIIFIKNSRFSSS